MTAIGAADSRLSDNAWAIFALPPGVRDLACVDYWDRSLERSQRRRALAASRVRRTATGWKLSAALLTAGIAVPAVGVAHAESSTATVPGTDDSSPGTSAGGSSVAAVQRALGIPVDGVDGPQTRAAVRAFQAAHGLEVDGIVGPITSGALGLSAPAGTSTSASLKATDDGPAPPAATTTAVQRALGLTADGVYGPVTRAAVRSYQRAHGLAVDGVVGPATLGALGITSASTDATTMSTSSTSSTSSSAATPVASSSAGALAAVSAAESQIGVPYETAGTGNGGFDCSGLTQWAFAKAGIALPRTSYAQFGAGSPVSRANVQAGDLVFFNTDGAGASHVGIAISNSTAISATTHGVMEHAISDSYWGAHYVGARRV